jgi:hypothetical protein
MALLKRLLRALELLKRLFHDIMETIAATGNQPRMYSLVALSTPPPTQYSCFVACGPLRMSVAVVHIHACPSRSLGCCLSCLCNWDACA